VIPLERAAICLDGEHVFELFTGLGETACPSCGSATVMPLARWLGSAKIVMEGEPA